MVLNYYPGQKPGFCTTGDFVGSGSAHKAESVTRRMSLGADAVVGVRPWRVRRMMDSVSFLPHVLYHFGIVGE